MVGQERPGVDRPGPGLHQGGQAGDEVRPIPVLPEEGGALDPPHHHVVQGRRGIQARLAGHGRQDTTIRRPEMQRPPLHYVPHYETPPGGPRNPALYRGETDTEVPSDGAERLPCLHRFYHGATSSLTRVFFAMPPPPLPPSLGRVY